METHVSTNNANTLKGLHIVIRWAIPRVWQLTYLIGNGIPCSYGQPGPNFFTGVVIDCYGPDVAACRSVRRSDVAGQRELGFNVLRCALAKSVALLQRSLIGTKEYTT